MISFNATRGLTPACASLKRHLLAFSSLFAFTLLFTSCEGLVHGSGKVISSVDKSPLDSVMITWRGEKAYTDKEGNFAIGQFVGCPAGCPELEIVLTKKGYETEYVNLTKGGSIVVENVVIELKPTAAAQPDLRGNKLGKFLYYSSMVIAAAGLVTLIMLFYVNVENKLLWFVVILFGTIGVHYNLLADFFDFKFLRPLIAINLPHFQDPSWYKVSVPVGALVFWVYWFKSRPRKAVEQKRNSNSALLGSINTK